MDLVTSGIDGVFNGTPLFMDVTIVSPVHGTGVPMPNSRNVDGAALARADRRNRMVDYPDVELSSSAMLLCLGVETYGRWSSHCLTLVRQLAQHKANNCPDYLQKPIQYACFARWWNLLSCEVQNIVGESVLRIAGSDLIDAADTSRQPSLVNHLQVMRLRQTKVFGRRC